MEIIWGTLIASAIGGIGLALVLLAIHRHAKARSIAAPQHLPSVSTNPINVASIPVSGVGGLGMVAAAIYVAFALPEAGYSIGIGLGLGVLLALGLIWWHSR